MRGREREWGKNPKLIVSENGAHTEARRVSERERIRDSEGGISSVSQSHARTR